MKNHCFGLSILIMLLFSASAWSQQSDFDEDIFEGFGDEDEESPLQLNGFLEGRFGSRLYKAKENEFYTMAELRAQLDISYLYHAATFKLVTDIKYSPLQPKPFEDIENGVGILDFRELSFSRSIGSALELKAGRQILSWGTGDLLFINDMFPKDWNSFFIGRQMEYLKAPTNAVKLSSYNDLFTMDIVWTPLFTSDRFINGSNMEYYSPLAGEVVGESMLIHPQERNNYVQDSELAIRLHKVFKRVEIDMYGYHGFWKTPEGFNEQNQYYFPKLSVTGASIRLPVFTGILNAEYGHYFSGDFEAYSPKPVRNSEDRLLIGFEKELAKNFMTNAQFYLEYINDYDSYLQNFDCFDCRDALKVMLTLRLDYLTLDQKLKISLMNFYSPTEVDLFSKNTISYTHSDHLELNLGAHYFTGANPYSFWGQFHTSSNLFFGIIWHY